MRSLRYSMVGMFALILLCCCENGVSAGKSDKGKTPPVSVTQQQQNFAKLKSDLEAIHGKSQVTQSMRQAVAQDLTQILSTANKPSQQSVQALASDLSQALADKKISTSEALKLSQDVSAVLSSANISQQAAQKLLADVQTLLKATGMTNQDAQTLVNDIRAIVTTAQQNAQNAKSKTKK